MPAPISLDLRMRIVLHREITGEGSILCARHFLVGEATVRRLFARLKLERTIKPKAAKGGPQPLISDEQLPLLAAVIEGPGVTVEDARLRWQESTGQQVSPETMRRAIHRAGMTKKTLPTKPPSASERTSSRSARRSRAK